MKCDVKTNYKTKKSQDNAKQTTNAQSTQRKTLEKIFFELLGALGAFVVKIIMP